MYVCIFCINRTGTSCRLSTSFFLTLTEHLQIELYWENWFECISWLLRLVKLWKHAGLLNLCNLNVNYLAQLQQNVPVWKERQGKYDNKACFILFISNFFLLQWHESAKSPTYLLLIRHLRQISRPKSLTNLSMTMSQKFLTLQMMTFFSPNMTMSPSAMLGCQFKPFVPLFAVICESTFAFGPNMLKGRHTAGDKSGSLPV